MTIEKKFVDSLSDFLSEIPSDSEEYKIATTLLDQLQQFFQTMHHSKPDELNELMVEWNTQPPLFNRIGQIVRSFYDQMVSISAEIPDRLGKIAQQDMEDASQRLQHIVEMTEGAANKTLDLSEGILEQLGKREEFYQTTLQQIDNSLKLDNLPPEVTETLNKTRGILQQNKEADEQIQGQLTEILIAQDYQDLTGQIIHKIINLLSTLEQDLVSLLETFGQTYVQQEKTSSNIELKGPLHKDSTEKQSQDDVDDLLSSLGF